MPYPNEHSCRIRDPGDFEKGSFRRIEGGEKEGKGARDGKKVSMIIGKLKGKTTTTTQAYRFPTDTWTEAQARAFCKEEGGSFEAASKKENKEDTGHEIIEAKGHETIIEILDEGDGAGRPMMIQGDMCEVNIINENGRYYSDEIVDEAFEVANDEASKGGLIGHIRHPGKGEDFSYPEIVMKYHELWREDNIGKWKAEVVETRNGMDLKACARQKVRIAVSMRGTGKEEKVEENGQTFSKVLPGYRIKTIDAVLDPGFLNAYATHIEEKKKEEYDMDEVKALQEKVDVLTTQISELVEASKKPSELDPETKKAVEEFKADRAALEEEKKAQVKVRELLEADEFKKNDTFMRFERSIEKQLKECKTVQDVELTYKSATRSALDYVAETKQPHGSGIVIHQPNLIYESGKKAPNIIEAIKWMSDGLPGDSDFSDPNKGVLTKKWVCENLIANYARFITENAMRAQGKTVTLGMRDGLFLHESKVNPLVWMTEALGDAEVYSGDIDSSVVAILKMIRPVYERLVALELCATLPIAYPGAKLPFLHHIYEETAADPKMADGVDENYAEPSAEGEEAILMTLIIDAASISLATAKKLKLTWTTEAMQDAQAYWSFNLETEGIKAQMDEIAREINLGIILDMLTGSSPSEGDNCATAGNVSYTAAPEDGYTQYEWDLKGLHKKITAANAYIVAARHRDADWIMGDEDAVQYIDWLKVFTSEGRGPKTSAGVRQIGTFAGEYNVYRATGLTDNYLLLGYKSDDVLQNTYFFMPYVMFYVGERIFASTFEHTRAVMSRFAKQKVSGKAFATVTITP